MSTAITINNSTPDDTLQMLRRSLDDDLVERVEDEIERRGALSSGSPKLVAQPEESEG